MKREKVRSSNVRSIGYDADARTLEVEFVNRSVYRYANVPAKVHRALMTAKSVGTEFGRLVKSGDYKYERLPDAEPVETTPLKGDVLQKQLEASINAGGRVVAHRVVKVPR